MKHLRLLPTLSFEESQQPAIQRLSAEILIIFIISYIIAHAIWRQTIFGEYSFVLLRIIFIKVFLLYFINTLGIEFLTSEIRKNFSLKTVRSSLILFIIFLVVLIHFILRTLFFIDIEDFSIRSFFDGCIIAPVNEEIVFRWIILGALLKLIKSPISAILISSLIFASSHNLDGLTQLIPLVLGGLIYGYLYFRTLSIPLCIGFHFLWNFMAFVPTPLL